MEIYHVENLSFSYPGAETPALSEITLDIGAGEFVVLTGRSGSGKTTLLRMLKSVLSPSGNVSGEVLFCGKPLALAGARVQAERIGYVAQSAESQIVTDQVWHELAFGLESLGYENAVIRKKAAEAAAFFGLEEYFHSDVAKLSGGLKQLLCLASVIVTEPEVILLDEPLSQLDPVAADAFMAALIKINRELGAAVILTEQNLEKVLPCADRLVVLDNGRILADGDPRETAAQLSRNGDSLIGAFPAAVRIRQAAEGLLSGESDDSNGTSAPADRNADGNASMASGNAGSGNADWPLTVREGRQWLEHAAAGRSFCFRVPEQKASARGEAGLSVRHLYFRYSQAGEDVLSDLDIELYPGETAVLAGGNGAGKSTLLKCLAGIGKPYSGSIQKKEKLRIAMLPQDPLTLLTGKTVGDDLGSADDVLERLSIAHLKDRHPYDLSGGERQIAAFAKVLQREPNLLLLDEPAKGLDPEYKELLSKELARQKQKGTAILLVSHDLEFCAENADRCLMMFRGQIISEGEPHDFFSSGNVYSTPAARICRGIVRNAVTPGDAAAAIREGAEKPQEPKEPDTQGPGDSEGSQEPKGASDSRDFHDTNTRLKADTQTIRTDAAATKMTRTDAAKMHTLQTDSDAGIPTHSKAALTAAICIWLLIPITLLASVLVFQGRRYALASVLVLAEGMIPFFLLFEDRRPPLKELLLLAVLSAIGVAGRAALFMFPSFKPVIAVAVISGIALGAEDGFIVGAMTMLVSNAFFAQGPWTPWEMFAAGLTGFLAGLLFSKDGLKRNRTAISLYGILACLVIYGGIMNPASAYMWDYAGGEVNLLAYYLSGLPVDLVHAAATALFLWFGAEPLMVKIRRAALRFGLRQTAG